jgi:hypothetical protein
MNNKNTVLVIGPTRTATTALWQGLKSVKTVSVAPTKENYFFGRRLSGKSNRDYGDYLDKHFSSDTRVDFEPSIFHSNSQLRAAFSMREIDRFVGILRPPIDLYKSAYAYNVRNGMQYDGFQAFFHQVSKHYSYRRVATLARDAGVSVAWLPHDALISDARLFLAAAGIPFDGKTALPLTRLNSSTKQVSALGSVLKKARALKRFGLVRAVAERVRGSVVYENLVYNGSHKAISISERELSSVRSLLLEEELFYQSLVVANEGRQPPGGRTTNSNE